MQNEIKKLYKKITQLLMSLIPENWKSIYLYASVINGKSGEMYFYYFPKKFIKTNPVNCYDVPDKFLINENAYNKNLQKLYGYIKNLNQITSPKWTNITINIQNNFFTIEYHFDNLVMSKYSDEERRIIWCYNNLKIPKESLTEEQRDVIEKYSKEKKIEPLIYSEWIEKSYRNETIQEEKYKIEEQPGTKFRKEKNNTYKTNGLYKKELREEAKAIKNQILKF